MNLFRLMRGLIVRAVGRGRQVDLLAARVVVRIRIRQIERLRVVETAGEDVCRGSDQRGNTSGIEAELTGGDFVELLGALINRKSSTFCNSTRGNVKLTCILFRLGRGSCNTSDAGDVRNVRESARGGRL